MGQLLEIKPTAFDTVVYTIKVSCITAVIEPPTPEEEQRLAAQPIGGTDTTYGQYKLNISDTLSSNLLSNIWYFYWPVRYDGRYAEFRNEFLLNRAGIERATNPGLQPP